MNLENKHIEIKQILFYFQAIANVGFFIVYLLNYRGGNFFVGYWAYGIITTTTVMLTSWDFYFSTFKPWNILPLVGVQIFLLAYCYYQEYYSLDFNYFDTGFFSNSISNLKNGHGYYNSHAKVNALADHFTPSLLLLTPIYFFADSGLVLVFFKYVFYILSIFFIFLLTKDNEERKKIRYFIIYLLLINQGIVNFLGFEFQSSNIIAFLVPLLFYLYEREKKLLLVCLIIFILGLKETSVFLFSSLALYILFEKKEVKKALILFSSSISFLFLYQYVIIPFVSDLGSTQVGIFDPFCCITEKKNFFFKILHITYYNFIFDPAALLYSFPTLFSSFLGNRPGSFSIDFHYHDMFVYLFLVILIIRISSKSGRFYFLDPANHVVSKFFFVVLFCYGLSFSKNSILAFANLHHPTKEKTECIDKIKKFDCFYSSKKKFERYEIFSQDCFSFLLSHQFRINTLGSFDQLKSQKGPYFIVLSDFPTARWPIEADFEPIKAYLKAESDAGDMKYYPEFFPLIVYSKDKF